MEDEPIKKSHISHYYGLWNGFLNVSFIRAFFNDMFTLFRQFSFLKLNLLFEFTECVSTLSVFERITGHEVPGTARVGPFLVCGM